MLLHNSLIDPKVQCMHYWKDSSTSQYRNKTVFSLVATHEEHFGVKASWDDFMAYHGHETHDWWSCEVKSEKVVI